jgi:hypothetical protein
MSGWGKCAAGAACAAGVAIGMQPCSLALAAYGWLAGWLAG